MATPPSFHEMHTNIKPRILGSAHCFEHKQMAQEGREMRKVHQIVDGFFFLLWFHQKQMKINIHDFRWFVSDSTKLGPLLITFSASNYPDFIHQHSFLDATLISHIIRKRKILFFYHSEFISIVWICSRQNKQIPFDCCRKCATVNESSSMDSMQHQNWNCRHIESQLLIYILFLRLLASPRNA